MASFITQPHGERRLGDLLLAHLRDERWTRFDAAVAFVKRSGTRHVCDALRAFSQRAAVRIIAGINCRGTTAEGLRELLDAVQPRGQLFILHNTYRTSSSTFHPKVYVFRNAAQAAVLLGSGNMTGGGLYTNYEASIALEVAIEQPPTGGLLAEIDRALDEWSNTDSPAVRPLTPDLLLTLVESGLVPPEAVAPVERDEALGAEGAPREPQPSSGFGSVPVPSIPVRIVAPTTSDTSEPLTEPVPAGANRVFLMTLQQTDVGVGQTTSGTSRRSPEIFIPLAARDFDHDFWGWPLQFTADQSRPGKMDRTGVRTRLGGSTITVNMMTWPDKHDFRLRSEDLRSAGDVGDILRLEKVDTGEYEYYAEIVPTGTERHRELSSLCTTPVRNSRKTWGYT